MSHGPPDLPIHLVPPLGGLLSTRGGHGKGLQPCLTIREDLTERAPNGPTGCTEPTQGAHITIQLCSDEYRSPAVGASCATAVAVGRKRPERVRPARGRGDNELTVGRISKRLPQ